jgi:hypothetical protein
MGSFSVQLQQFADKTSKRADDIVGRVIVGIAQRLDERSPVGDATYWQSKPPKGYTGGRFRGNWQLGIGIIPAGETGRIDPSGSATLGTIIASIPDQPAGTIAYLSNNVPYAQRIEDGWSRQAPQGLVGITAMEFQQVVDQAAAA